MKTKLFFNAALISRIGLFLFIFPFLGFSTPETKLQDYLSVVVMYEWDRQFIQISSSLEESKNFAILYYKPSSKAIKALVEKGYKVDFKEKGGTFDNTFVFSIIKEYEGKGWRLESHDFSVSKSSALGEGTRIQETDQISYFLFTK